MRSKTIRGGSELSIDFNPGTDMRRAEQLIWNRIGATRSEFPAGTELTVEQMTPSVFPIISLVLTGGERPAQLRDYAFYELAPRIKNIPDVLYAKVAGGDVREIEVEARPDDLLAAGLSAADLADQIGQAHRLQPVGRIERPPFAFQIIVNTQAETARQIEDLVIATKNNQPVRVRDVADVAHLAPGPTCCRSASRARTPWSSPSSGAWAATRSTSRVTLEATCLPSSRPPRNIQATVVYDQATFVRTAVDNVRDAILIGGLFSVLILLAFLRSWRATLISALAIPTTLAITFLFLHWAGETLNLMSLGGLAVAIGLIIDDTVVVDREHRPAPGRRQAPAGGQRPPARADPVDAASGEITGAVIGSTLTTVLVFVPLAFIVGVYGQFFAALSWSLSIAVLVSMVISLTLVPVFAAKFLAGRPMPPAGPHLPLSGQHLRAGSGCRSALSVGDAGRCRWPRSASACSSTRAFPTVAEVPKPGEPPPAAAGQGTPDGPDAGHGRRGLHPRLLGAVRHAAGRGTEEMVREVEKILSENPDVQAYVRRTGAENGLFATQTSRGDIQVVLRPPKTIPSACWRSRSGPSSATLKRS